MNNLLNIFGNFNNFQNQFNLFKQNFMMQNNMSPQEKVQQLLDSGQMTMLTIICMGIPLKTV